MIDLSHIQVVLRALESLLPCARNSRTHSDEQVAQVAASIKEFGWTSPILVDGEGTVIAGHARLMAARKLGMDQVPVIVLTHLTPAQRRALVIADNKLAMTAGWDETMLREEMSSLDLDGFDLAVVDNGVPGGWGNRFKNAWEPVFHFCRQQQIKFRAEAVSHASDDCFDYSPDNPKSRSGSGLLGTGARGAAADGGKNQSAWQRSRNSLSDD